MALFTSASSRVRNTFSLAAAETQTGIPQGGNCGMKKPELTDMGWLGPKDEMDRASHLFGKCSECREIICVEKAKADRQRTGQETREVLDELFRTHLKLKHSEDRSHGR
jgi:hypothetical protein